MFTNLEGLLKLIPCQKQDLFSKVFLKDAQDHGFFLCLDKKNKQKRNNTLTLVLSLTERCNCRCRYCFLDAQKQGLDMTEEIAFASIDKAIELAKGKELNLAFFGGEPTVSFDLLKKCVKYVETHKQIDTLSGHRYTITTNGIISDTIADFLIDHNFKVSLSMDGIGEVQTYQRPLANGEDSYPIVTKTIQKLTKNLNVKIRATVTEFSVNKMSDSVEFLSKLGVKRIHFGPVTPGGRGATNNPKLQPPKANVFIKNLRKAIKMGKKLNVDVICFPYMNAMYSPMTYCDGNINNRLVITPQGIVSSCVEIQNKLHPLFKAFYLGEYEENKKEISLKREHRKSCTGGCETLRKKQVNCKNCPLFFFCGGGCPTRNYRGSGSTEHIDTYRCTITKGIMPYILKSFYQEIVKEK